MLMNSRDVISWFCVQSFGRALDYPSEIIMLKPRTLRSLHRSCHNSDHRKFLDGLAKLAALSSSIIEREWCAALSGESFQKMCGFEFMPSSLISPIAATTPYGFHKPLLPACGG
jgi:hypothetical protein